MKKYFVTAIGTDSGKTLISAILVKALKADYWKPIQSGLPKDEDKIRDLVGNFDVKIHQSAYFLKKPASPHDAAQSENIEIELQKILLPKTQNTLIIEGAGGVLVPLNQQDFVIDIAQNLDIEIILVANLYLGSINHTLLTFRELQSRNLKIKGIIFNGKSNPSSEQIILHHTQLPCLFRVAEEIEINADVVDFYAHFVKRLGVIK